jgi:hypothetical protein
MTSETNLAHDTHRFTVLGICWVLYGVLRLLLAMWLATFTPVATVMFGALLSRVADPFSMMSAFHFFYLFAIILSALCGVIGFLAGLALLAGQDSGRGLALIASLLSLSELPVGITLGVYTLVTLLPVRVVAQDRRQLRTIETSPSPAR